MDASDYVHVKKKRRLQVTYCFKVGCRIQTKKGVYPLSYHGEVISHCHKGLGKKEPHYNVLFDNKEICVMREDTIELEVVKEVDDFIHATISEIKASLNSAMPKPIDVRGITHYIESRIDQMIKKKIITGCCCVCACFTYSNTHCELNITSVENQKLKINMNNRLRPICKLPDWLVAQYFNRLVPDAILYLPAIKNEIFVFCSSCLRSLRTERGEMYTTDCKGPTEALANGNFSGFLSEHLREKKFNYITIMMCALTTVTSYLHIVHESHSSTVNDTERKKLMNHCLTFVNTEGPLNLMIPSDVSPFYKVVIAGPLSDSNSSKIRKFHIIDRNEVEALTEEFLLKSRVYNKYKIAKNNAILENLSRVSSDMFEEIDGIPKWYDTSHVQFPSFKSNSETDFTLKHSLFTSGDASDNYKVFEYHRSNIFYDGDDILECTWPDIFVSGFGGFSNSFRYSPMGKEHVVRLLLKRADMNRFRTNASALLWIFDILQREKCALYVNMHCKLYPSDTILASKISTAGIMNYFDEKQKEILFKERGLNYTYRLNSDGKVAQKFIKVVERGAAHYLYSKEDRNYTRLHMYSYYFNFGRPSLFLSFAINHKGSLLLYHYANPNEYIDILNITEKTMPSEATLREASLSNPVAVALLYEYTKSVIIDCLLGWDVNSCKPYKYGGLCGYVKGYIGIDDEQEQGGNHSHLLIWIHGCPITSEFMNHITDDILTQISDYAASITTSVLPIIKQKEPLTCNCSSSILKFQELDYDLLRRSGHKLINGKKRNPPIVAVCFKCKKQFTHNMYIDLAINQFLHAGNDKFDNELICNDARTRWLLAKVQPLSFLNNDDFHVNQRTLDLTSLMRSVLIHNWRHCFTCFKYNCVCRFNMPREICLRNSAAVVKEGEFSKIEIFNYRSSGNEYVNTTNPLITSYIGSNSDLRVLSNASNAVIEYTISYSSAKHEKNIQSIAPLIIANVLRNVLKNKESKEDAFHVGRRSLLSCLYKLTEFHEVGSCLAVSGLLNGSSYFSSHDIAIIEYGQLLNFINKEVMTCTPVEDLFDKDFVYTFPKFTNYLFRNEIDETCSYFQFQQLYVIKNGPGGSENSIDFNSSHPCVNKRHYSLREKEVIVEISGPQIPDIASLMLDATNEEVSLQAIEKREQYAMFVYLLFIPFRLNNLISLRSNSQKWLSYKRVWKFQLRSYAVQYLKNRQEYFIGRRMCREEAKEKKENLKSSFESASDKDFNIAESDSSNDSDSNYDSGSDCEFESGYLNFEELEQLQRVAMMNNSSELLGNSHYSDVVSDLKRGVSSAMLRAIGNLVSNFEYVNYKIEDTVGHNCFNIQDAIIRNSFDVIKEKKLKRMEFCFVNGDNLDNSEVRKSYLLDITNSINSDDGTWLYNGNVSYIKPLKSRMKLREVSYLFGLNYLQHCSFIIIGRQLLERFKRDMEGIEHPSEGFRCIIGGEGGTGKSYILEALQYLSKSWSRPESILTVAYTGIAAAHNEGGTLNHEAGISIREKATYFNIERIHSFASKAIIAIDECYMISKSLFVQASEQFKKLGCSDYPFASRIVILLGDQFQLPPIAGKGSQFLFNKPEIGSLNYVLMKEGWDLYNTFDSVIILKENVRCKSDLHIQRFLRLFRFGIVNTDGFKLLNSWKIKSDADIIKWVENVRLTASKKKAFNNCKFILCPLVYPTNLSKEIASRFIISQLQLNNTGTVAFRILAKFKQSDKSRKKYSLKQVQNIYSITEDKFTPHRQPVLDLMLNQPVLLALGNQHIDLGLANNSTGYIHFILFSPDTTFVEIIDIDSGGKRLLPSKEPLIVFVNVPSYKGKRVDGMPDTFPDTVIPVFFEQSFVSIKTKTIVDNKDVHLSAIMNQFPVVQAYTLTFEKLQSLTVDGICFGKFRECRYTPPPGSTYVGYSRPTNCNTVASLVNYTVDDVARFKPKRSQFVELLRMHLLHHRTLHKNKFYDDVPLFPENIELDQLKFDIYNKELKVEYEMFKRDFVDSNYI